MTRRAWILFLALTFLWGTPYFMIRVAVRQLDPATLVFARTAASSVLLVPFALQRRVLATLKGLWGWLVLYTVIEIAVPWLLLATAEQHLTSSFSGLLVATVPLVAITIGRFTHPEDTITRTRLAGLTIGLVGVAAVVGLDIGGGSLPWIGVMGVVVVCYAAGPTLLALKLHRADGLAVTSASVALVALAYLPWGLTHWPSHLRAETYGAIVWLAVFCTAAAFLVMLALVAEVGPARSVVITFGNTAVAVLIGTVGLHEPFSAPIAVGFPLIIVGSIFATRRTVSAGVPRAPTPPQSGLVEPTQSPPP